MRNTVVLILLYLVCTGQALAHAGHGMAFRHDWFHVLCVLAALGLLGLVLRLTLPGPRSRRVKQRLNRSGR